ncbi:MAG: hypothetical protein IPM63_04765 [Acidobacteriota bacterium]|nr:MAG: hypothetical protein IPM63_04765 [Acidobacteriota bacterium]
MRYGNENELRKVLERFETATIAREEWGHPEHLIVAYFYCCGNDENTACLLMKEGILKLLDVFGVDKEKEMPYHETMTGFWIRTVHAFVAANPDLNAVGACSALISGYGKNYPLEFYSRELLFSDPARESFVEPDIRPLSSRPPALATPE